MTIRKKMGLSHLCVIVIPVLLSVVVGAVLFHVFGSRYWDTPAEMLEDADLSDTVGWTIYECAEQYSYGPDYETDPEWDPALAAYAPGDDGIWDYLSEKLAGLGYQVQVRVDGTVKTDNLSQSDRKDLENAAARRRDYTERSGNYRSITAVFDEEGQTIRITAVSHTANRAIAYLALYLLFVVLSIVGTSLVLMGWLRRSIMTPLEALRRGTRQIADGELDSTIAYQKRDEFGDVCRDFDEMRLHLKASVDAQARYEKDRQDMISGISHDLRTPLTSIKGYAEGLQEGIANTEEKQRRYYRAIHVCALEMETLLDSLSTFSRLENSAYKYNLEETDMDEYIREVIEDGREELFRRKAVVLYENRAERTAVLADRREWQRVFMNLFENSVRYRAGETSAIRVTLQNEGENLIIYVADDGPGVAEGELESIFNIFYRADASRAKAENGSGLGLAIVKRIVEGHGGSIEAYNDGGLTMKITLPLA